MRSVWAAFNQPIQYSRDVLKVDFRTGLRELDEQAALERDAESFDPTIALRDYDAIDLPVFCVSARDYARINSESISVLCIDIDTDLSRLESGGR